MAKAVALKAVLVSSMMKRRQARNTKSLVGEVQAVFIWC